MLRRTLTYASESGDIPVPITIDSPRQGERDWSCAYEIGWPDSPRCGFGYGVDATQAMLLALKAIGTDLYTSDYTVPAGSDGASPGTATAIRCRRTSGTS